VVQEAGFDVWVDHDLSKNILHVGRMAYGADVMRIGPEVAAVMEQRSEDRETDRKLELRRLK
jgi:hypothetical protein